jgi:hypothetical protein
MLAKWALRENGSRENGGGLAGGLANQKQDGNNQTHMP